MCKKIIKFVIIVQFVLLLCVILLFNPISTRLYTLFYAEKYGIDNSIYYRQIKTESHFRCFIKSHKDAIGPGQVIYTTAVYVDPNIKKWQLYIPWINLNISAQYMRYLKGRYQDNYSLALAAYNWGETNVDNQLRRRNIVVDSDKNYREIFVNVRETYSYLIKILN